MTASPPLLSAGYVPPAGSFDEMATPAGHLRPHWENYLQGLSGLGQPELAHRWATARHRIRENGVTYNVYGDPLGMDRPWSLDAIPLLIPAGEWQHLEAGLIQRAHLLNQVLADLYGPQSLLQSGQIPPALVFANPGFWRACHGVPVPNGTYLNMLAVDLARAADGRWWVLADRAQAPSGAGYALENRIVLSETFPDLFRESQVCRLASFFRHLRESLIALSPNRHENPRVVLLTPGPYNETYFEHSYLARYLGFPLVQGADLTVRNSRVFLKTLEGLKQVDVILRRMDDSFCDPIELRSDSYLGVAGLVEAIREGHVAVANALGSGLIETSAFMPFLPGLSEKLLGEPLKLPSVATWWCGQPKAHQYTIDNLNFLVIKPAFPSKGMEPVFGGKLNPEDRTRLLARMAARPYEYVGQDLVNLSTAPVLSDQGLTPRKVVLRVYLAASGNSWVVMPGGLARVTASATTSVVSMQRGGGSKDTWVLSSGPVDPFTMRRARTAALEINRGGKADLPSRVVDHLFWLGRYAERSEHMARMLRCILIRITGESGASGIAEWDSILRLHECLESPDSRLAEDEPSELQDLEQEVLSLIFEEERYDSLHTNLTRAARAAAQVRDRLSSDLLRVVNRFPTIARTADKSAWGYVPAADALAVLNTSITTLAALRGIEMENMTRGPGWHFLSTGRRIERALQTVDLFRKLIVPFEPKWLPTLEMLLEVGDSAMTYRSRYFTTLQPAPVLDLLMNDAANPRSLAFQLQDLWDHCDYLSEASPGTPWPFSKQRRLADAADRLFEADIQDLNGTLLDSLLADVETALPEFSNAITNTYFSHAEMEQRA